MYNKDMQKVLIIGSPGAGKSTFALKLSEVIAIPVYHLDNLNWKSDRTVVPRATFEKRLDALLKKEKWIIDGNYQRTMEKRIKVCDTIFFLDIPKADCLEGIRARIGKKRPDMPWVETELDEEFVQLVYNFDTKAIFDLLDKYNDKTVYILRSRQEMDTFIKDLKLKIKSDKTLTF